MELPFGSKAGCINQSSKVKTSKACLLKAPEIMEKNTDVTLTVWNLRGQSKSYL